MSKTAQRHRSRVNGRWPRPARWAVHVRYSDGSGQIDAFATREEAQRLVDVVQAVKRQEPDGIESVDLVAIGGAR